MDTEVLIVGTLLRMGGSKADSAPLQKALATIGAPFAVLDVPDRATGHTI
jgi:hypothetical protein